MVQQAVAQFLTPEYEKLFHPNSYGFRPKKSAIDAVKKVAEYMTKGYKWLIDLDLEKFFDKVNQDKLMGILSRNIKDGDILSLIGKFLRSGVLVNEQIEETIMGTPQGGNLSPLLANIMLNELDWELEKRGLRFVRYADDCVIFVKSEKSAKRVFESITRYIENKLLLKVNREKSKVVRPSELKYLGFAFSYTSKENLYKPKPHKDSVKKFRAKLKELTKRSWGVSNAYKRDRINMVIRGWVNYFRIGRMKTVCQKADNLLRARFRMCIWKHWKNPITRYKRLIQLGVSRGIAAKAAWSHGYARVCRGKAVSVALSNVRLKQYGLISIEEYYLKSC
ncbi:Retron-type reverse transcriptase [Lachnospiraceae bacterium TWA4]|nr:Retron-type reverse transcriptase [Lachnospiraceae bacterium TWA4]